MAEETLSREEFLNKLTPTEKRGYYALISRIHSAGTVRISSLSRETCITGTAYYNLIAKMKKYGVAETIRGERNKRGIIIIITEPELKKEAETYVAPPESF